MQGSSYIFLLICVGAFIISTPLAQTITTTERKQTIPTEILSKGVEVQPTFPRKR